MTMDVFWSAWDRRGFEHLRLTDSGSGVSADSIILAVDGDGRPFRARYVVECDAQWTVASARIELLAKPGHALDIRVDEAGRWVNVDTGHLLPLDGCIDIDIYPSPFTNTLPIRRLAGAAVGQAMAIGTAWIGLPELTVHRVPQEYTLLERLTDGAVWRFRALDDGFTADLIVDRHGLVRDYPGIARRIL